MLGSQKARVREEEADVGELGLRPREEGREGLGVARKVLVAPALVVIQLAHLAVLEFRPLPLLLPPVALLPGAGFAIRVSRTPRSSRLHGRTGNCSEKFFFSA